MAWSTPQGPVFEREHGLTEREWLQQLPGAVGVHSLQLGQGEARVAIGGGELQLRWHALPPRQIALMRMPRLHVAYQFTGLADDERARFLRYFDLYMQKGGG